MLSEQIANDEALARYLQYGSGGEEEEEDELSPDPQDDLQGYSTSSEYSEDEEESEESDEEHYQKHTEDDEEGESRYEMAAQPSSASRKPSSVPKNLTSTMNPPEGLYATKIDNMDMVAAALREADAIFDDECAGQIATNQHFFVNLPFPIGGGVREAHTALFELGNPKIPQLSGLIRESLVKLSPHAGGTKVLHEGMLARANIIVRRYTNGQHISFHVDERECASVVYGFILQNDHPTHKGLEFRRGEGKQQLSYVLPEYPGTAFVMTNEARYKWKHGLPPVTACRVSVTCRFFKTHIIEYHRSLSENPDAQPKRKMFKYQRKRLEQLQLQEQQKQQAQQKQPAAAQKPQQQTPPKPQAKKPAKQKPTPKSKQTKTSNNNNNNTTSEEEKKEEEVHIEICLNKDPRQVKPAVVFAKANIAELISTAKNKLRVKAKKFFSDGGDLIESGRILKAGDTVYVSLGEDFAAVAKKPAAPPKFQPTAPPPDATNTLYNPEIQARVDWWSHYRYAQLTFKVLQDLQGKTPSRGVVVPSTDELGKMVETSHLSIPELREIIFALRPFVEDPNQKLCWKFHTSLWDEGRSTSIIAQSLSDGAWIEFLSEGKPPLKGSKKRDGPLWKLEGGLNNPAEANGPIKPLSEVAAETTQEFLASKESNKNKVVVEEDDSDDEGEYEEESGAGRKKHVKSKKKSQNTYQSKRGVEFTDKYVLFAGTVWCSSYYKCELNIDGVEYTSATQFVMSEQARLFGDEARRQELLASNDTPAPHRDYDHKAPKTGVRRVQNFDADVWGKYKERLMWRGMYEKFTQNAALKSRMLGAGDRTFVEATEDPMWGIGILLSHPDAKNERRWRGPNLMGQMLTTLSRLVRLEDTTPDPLSLSRIQYLHKAHSSSPASLDKMIEFGEKGLRQTGDAEQFVTPAWPGSKAMDEVVRAYLPFADI